MFVSVIETCNTVPLYTRCTRKISPLRKTIPLPVRSVAALFAVLSGKIEVRETTQGAFPGDEVTNLNDHRLYGGKEGYVRDRYIVTTYKTEYGAFIVKRDGVKFKAFGLFGLLEMLIYLGILIVGYIWIWQKGALEWV